MDRSATGSNQVFALDGLTATPEMDVENDANKLLRLDRCNLSFAHDGTFTREAPSPRGNGAPMGC